MSPYAVTRDQNAARAARLRNFAFCILIFEFLVFCAFCTTAQGKYSGGAGTPENPYKIADCNDLYTLADDTNDYNKCFVMTTDIDLDPNLPGRRQLTTALIAPYPSPPFAGTFDGNDCNITNLIIDTNGLGNNYLGLFGAVDGSELKNICIREVRINGGNYSCYLGGLVGSAGYTFDKGTMIKDCSSSGTITAGYHSICIGGLVGINTGFSKINGCFSTATVAGGDRAFGVGGLVGSLGYSWSLGTISNCYSRGSVSGGNLANHIGGLVGVNEASPVICSYSICNVSGGSGAESIGGLVGSCHGDGDITHSYFLDPNDGGGPDNGIGEPLTNTEMKQQASFVDWDFVGPADGPNDIWSICETMNYPKLTWQIPAADMLCPDGVTFVDYSYFADHWLWTDYGDVNGLELSGNGKIENADFALFADWWGQTACGDCGGADYNGDNAVDSADLQILFDNWLATDYGDCEGAELTGDGFVGIDDALAFSNQWLDGI